MYKLAHNRPLSATQFWWRDLRTPPLVWDGWNNWMSWALTPTPIINLPAASARLVSRFPEYASPFHAMNIQATHMQKTVTLALVIIARNEERCIARCIESAKRFVDKVLVLDTGSTDATVKIAATCGAQVHHFIWCDDFSAARNRALELADADWHLILDADEWLIAGGPWLASLATQAPLLGVVSIHSTADQGRGTQTSRSPVSRLLPRGVRYQGMVHEQPVADWPRVMTPLIVQHDGYMPEQMRKKRNRNRNLLLREMQKNGDDPYLNYQLGVDAELAGEHKAACNYYEFALRNLGNTAGYAHDLCVRHLHCLGKAQRFEEAVAFSALQMSQWSTSPDFFFVLGGLMLDMSIDSADGDPMHWLSMAEAAWERCLELGEAAAELSGSVAGRGSYLAAHNLAVMHEQLGRRDKARALRQRHPMPQALTPS